MQLGHGSWLDPLAPRTHREGGELDVCPSGIASGRARKRPAPWVSCTRGAGRSGEIGPVSLITLAPWPARDGDRHQPLPPLIRLPAHVWARLPRSRASVWRSSRWVWSPRRSSWRRGSATRRRRTRRVSGGRPRPSRPQLEAPPAGAGPGGLHALTIGTVVSATPEAAWLDEVDGGLTFVAGGALSDAIRGACVSGISSCSQGSAGWLPCSTCASPELRCCQRETCWRTWGTGRARRPRTCSQLDAPLAGARACTKRK